MKQFGFEKLESEDEAELPVNAQKAKDIKFKTNKKGHLILPPKSDFKLLKMRLHLPRKQPLRRSSSRTNGN